VRLVLCQLYPAHLSIYADRGNVQVLRQRCAWRGIELVERPLELGGTLERGGADLYLIGGGQDRDQVLVASDLQRQRDVLHGSVADGAAVLAVCGGYQMLGHRYLGHQGDEIPGVGLVDLETVAGERRMIGNILCTCDLDDGEGPRQLVGFENHAGRTLLGPGVTPLARVVAGHGNDGESGFEGVRQGKVVGTYIHGPLLPKNPWLADWLIARALERAHGSVKLEPLDDAFERRAADSAARIARA
jgi:lipid II isoglutaminyl synthase (glutamine-hydrolysing)